MKFLKSLFLFTCIILLPLAVLSAQNTNEISLNQKYKYPVAFGVEYKSISPIAELGTEYGGDFLTSDISVTGFIPLDFMPSLQPFLRIGFTGQNAVEDNYLTEDELAKLQRFNNSQLYGEAGIAYKSLMTKQFELGAALGCGLTQLSYEDIYGDGIVYGQLDFIAEASVSAGINISYNINFSATPTVRFTQHIGPTVERFDGFSMGFAFSGSYRWGEDPDSPQAEIRSIKIDTLEFPPVFAPMQSYYSKHPVTTISLKNIEKSRITDIDVSFFQAGFMDTPTKAGNFDSIDAGGSIEVDIPAIYNQQVFTTEGITPLTGEIIVDYKSNGRIAHQKFPVSYDLYDKESLTWDDDNKVAAFITPSDSALRNYSSYIRQTCKDYTVDGFSSELQTAMQIFYALGELGVLYQKDPTSPFEAAQENPLIVDAISLPRNTLTRATGDCDDLTVLFCSLLESVGIETAFITVPGHIYAAFKTSMPSKSYKMLHPEKEMTINIDGQLWVPLEITLIGEADFLTAWRTGVEEFTAYDDNPAVRA